MVHPYVVGIRIFPIKSLDCLDLTEGRILAGGALASDRRWAIVDKNGRFVNGKRNPVIHKIRSATNLQIQRIRFWTEDGTASERVFSLQTEGEGIEAWLSGVLGFPAFLAQDATTGFPDDTASPGPTIISRSTLGLIAEWFELSLEEARARFRTNIEIDGCEPFWEDALFGSRGNTATFRVGTVQFEGVNPCQRCIVPTRDSRTGLGDGQFVSRFRKMRELTLPAWSSRNQFNHFYRVAVNTRLKNFADDMSIHVGDEVERLGTSTITANNT